MLPVIKLTVLNKLLFIILFATTLNANDDEKFDLNKNNVINVDIQVGKYNIFDFPFDIDKFKAQIIHTNKVQKNSLNNLSQDIKILKKPVEENLLDNTAAENEPKLPPITPTKKGQKEEEKGKPIGNESPQKISSKESVLINAEKKTLEIFPKKEEKYEVVIFGGSRPVILSLNAIAAETTRYFNIFDSGKKEKEEKELLVSQNESDRFLDIFRYLYVNKELPEFIERNKEENISYYDGKLTSKLTKYYTDDNYEVKEYFLSSKLPIEFYINEETFSTDSTVAISFDTQDNFIYPNQTIRYFIVNKIYQ